VNFQIKSPGFFSCPKANEGTKAKQRRTRMIGRESFIIPLKG